VIIWEAKTSADVRPYGLNWGPMLKDDALYEVRLTATGVTLDSYETTGNQTMAVVSGGISGTPGRIVADMTTIRGYRYRDVIWLPINDCEGYIPSSATKRDIVSMAYEECALSGYEFDVTPDELFTGLRKLDALMAQWKAESIDLSYNAPVVFGQGDLEDLSGIPDAAINAVAIALARRICPQMGKSMSAESRGALNSAMITVRALTARTPEMGYPRNVPRGSGNRYLNSWLPFIVDVNRCECVGEPEVVPLELPSIDYFALDYGGVPFDSNGDYVAAELWLSGVYDLYTTGFDVPLDSADDFDAFEIFLLGGPPLDISVSGGVPEDADDDYIAAELGI